MEETEHVLLVGEPATRFARHFKLKLDRQLSPKRTSFKAVRPRQVSGPTDKTLDLYRAMRIRRTVGLETVGAVALDPTDATGNTKYTYNVNGQRVTVALCGRSDVRHVRSSKRGT